VLAGAGFEESGRRSRAGAGSVWRDGTLVVGTGGQEPGTFFYTFVSFG